MPPACRLYLITPPRIDDLAAFGRQLGSALEGGDVGALQLRLKGALDELIEAAVGALAPMAHARDIALILNDRPDLAARLGCDGAHRAGTDALLRRGAAHRARRTPDRKRDPATTADAPAGRGGVEAGRRRPAAFGRLLPDETHQARAGTPAPTPAPRDPARGRAPAPPRAPPGRRRTTSGPTASPIGPQPGADPHRPPRQPRDPPPATRGRQSRRSTPRSRPASPRGQSLKPL